MLYSTAAAGGNFNAGVIFRMNQDGSGFQLLKSFGDDLQGGRRPAAELMEAQDGTIYGTTEEGGTLGRGTAFRLNKDGGGFSVLKSFGGADGAFPQARLLAASDGMLYGTTTAGGDTNDYGTVFRMATNGADFTVLVQFARTNGADPEGPLIEASDGMLYGTTYSGGQSNLGTVFRLSKDGNTFEVLNHFSVRTVTGYGPVGGLVEGSNGDLFGVASSGGSNSVGLAFTLNKDGTGYRALKHFAATNGATPADGLRLCSDGLLYGTTFDGGANSSGVIYRLDQTGGGFQVLTNLAPASCPVAALVEGSDGMLYGTTQLGGDWGNGTIFKVGKDGAGFTVLRSLDARGGDGANSRAALTGSTDGALYGTTRAGGNASGGTIFAIRPTGQNYHPVFSFGAAGTGLAPSAPLMEGADGLLYGCTEAGGASAKGTVFRVAKSGEDFTTLYNAFSGAAGYEPRAGLIQMGGGALVGAMTLGGSSIYGTLFQLNPADFTYTTLRSFTNASGANPMQTLTRGSDGWLYGTAYFGGTTVGNGKLFKVSTNGSGYTELKSFGGGSDGANPLSPLLEGSDGMLYGTTYAGGATNNAGTVFRIAKSGTGFLVLHSFTGISGDGRHPCGHLVWGPAGVLYGTTETGGANKVGTIFRVTTNGSQYAVIASFDSTSGAFPRGGLVTVADGSLLGTADQGGDMDFGTVFRFGNPLEFLEFASLAGGKVALACVGQAGTNYMVERTTSPATGGAWDPVTSTNAPSLGRFLVVDQNPPPETAVYRMRR